MQKQRELYMKQCRIYFYIDIIRKHFFSDEVKRQYKQQKVLYKDNVWRALTDEGGTIIIVW